MGCLWIDSFASRQYGDTDWSGSRSTRSTNEMECSVGDQQRITITDAEVLGVIDGIDDATGQRLVVLTLAR